MMLLSHFRDVHPNWGTIETLSPAQSRALSDLLSLAILLDDDLTSDERLQGHSNPFAQPMK